MKSMNFLSRGRALALGVLLLAGTGLAMPALSQENEVPNAEETFSANEIIQARGGENVKWPEDPKFKTTIEQCLSVKAYNDVFKWKDNLRALKVKVFEKIPTDRKVVFLTFDDGPYTNEAPDKVASTEELLDIMRAKKATGTFFVQGVWAFKNTNTLRRILAEGSTIGNHTCHHPSDGSYLAPSKLMQPPLSLKLAELPADWQGREVLWGRAAIVYSLGNPQGVMPYFRAPHGSGVVYYSAQRPVSQTTLKQVADAGHVTINGPLVLSDASGASAEQLKRTYKSYFSKGGDYRGEILWLHSGLKSTVGALPAIIDMFHEMGYTVEALPVGLERSAY